MKWRVCNEPGCVHLGLANHNCWRHGFSSRSSDPLTEDGLSDTEWWPIARTRLSRLKEATKARDRSPGRRGRRLADAIRDERALIGKRALPLLTAEAVDHWRATKGAPSWRLPPDGCIAEFIRFKYPKVPLDDLQIKFRSLNPSPLQYDLANDWAADDWAGPPKLLEYLARRDLESSSPTPAPFWPITQRRRLDDDSKNALVAQEERNLAHIESYSTIIVNVKHWTQDTGLKMIFDDPKIDTSVPPGTIVYHQMRRPPRSLVDQDERVGQGCVQARLLERAFEAHLQVPVGAYVRYDHVRSATVKIWWFGTIGPYPSWLNEPIMEEDGVRLELAPRRGLYISSASSQAVNSHLLYENELILPAGSVWRVNGHRDVVQSDNRHDPRSTNERLHAIQMVEVDPNDVDTQDVISMTYGDDIEPSTR